MVNAFLVLLFGVVLIQYGFPAIMTLTKPLLKKLLHRIDPATRLLDPNVLDEITHPDFKRLMVRMRAAIRDRIGRGYWQAETEWHSIFATLDRVVRDSVDGCDGWQEIADSLRKFGWAELIKIHWATGDWHKSCEALEESDALLARMYGADSAEFRSYDALRVKVLAKAGREERDMKKAA